VLTDDDVSEMLVARFAGEGSRTSLDEVIERGTARKRNQRIRVGVVAALALVVVGGAAAIVTRQPHVDPAAMTRDCNKRYVQLVSGRTDRSQLPLTLPSPALEMSRNGAMLRVYADLASVSGKRFVFDCERTGSKPVGGSLTVSAKAGGPVFFLITDYYRAYFPDGTSALVGLSRERVLKANVTAATPLASTLSASASPAPVDGDDVPTAISDHIFAAWGRSKTLDNARVAITMDLGGGQMARLISQVRLPMLPGTFDPVSFDAVCRLGLADGITNPSSEDAAHYVGDYKPTLKFTSGDSTIWLYGGKVPYACTYNHPILDGATGLEPVWSPDTKEGYGLFWGTGQVNDRIAGRVPLDATDVQVTGIDGVRVHASVTGGLFTFVGSTSTFDRLSTVIVATSPTKIYTIANGKMTTSRR
jgi:hypothetical protein